MQEDSLQRGGQLALAARILLAALGVYSFCWGVVALCAAGTFPLGADFHDGETLGSILALLLYPVAFLWAIGTPSLWRVAAVLLGSGALMISTASLIQSALT